MKYIKIREEIDWHHMPAKDYLLAQKILYDLREIVEQIKVHNGIVNVNKDDELNEEEHKYFGDKIDKFSEESNIVRDEDGYFKFDIKGFLNNSMLLGTDYSPIMIDKDIRNDIILRFAEHFKINKENDEDFESPYLKDPDIDINQVFKDINESSIEEEEYVGSDAQLKKTRETILSSILSNINRANASKRILNTAAMQMAAERGPPLGAHIGHTDIVREFERVFMNRYGSFIILQDNQYKLDIAMFMKSDEIKFDKMKSLEYFRDFYKSKFLDGAYGNGFYIPDHSPFVENPVIDTFQVMKDINENSDDDFGHKKEWKIRSFVSDKYESSLEVLMRIIFQNIIRYNLIVLNPNGYRSDGAGELIHSFENDNNYVFMVKQSDGQIKFDISKFITDYDDMFPNIKDGRDFIKNCMILFKEYYTDLVNHHDPEYETFSSPFLKDPVVDIYKVFKDINESIADEIRWSNKEYIKYLKLRQRSNWFPYNAQKIVFDEEPEKVLNAIHSMLKDIGAINHYINYKTQSEARKLSKEFEIYSQSVEKYDFIVKIKSNDQWIFVDEKYRFDINVFFKSYDTLFEVGNHIKFIGFCTKIFKDFYEEINSSNEWTETRKIRNEFFVENPKIDTFKVMKDINENVDISHIKQFTEFNEGVIDKFKGVFKKKEKKPKTNFPEIQDGVKIFPGHKLFNDVWDLLGDINRVNDHIKTANGYYDYRYPLPGEVITLPAAPQVKGILDFKKKNEEYSFVVEHKDHRKDGRFISYTSDGKTHYQWRFDIAIFLKNYEEMFNVADEYKKEFIIFSLIMFKGYWKQHDSDSRVPEYGDGTDHYTGELVTPFVKNPELSTFDVMKDINESKLTAVESKSSKDTKYEMLLSGINFIIDEVSKANTYIDRLKEEDLAIDTFNILNRNIQQFQAMLFDEEIIVKDEEYFKIDIKILLQKKKFNDVKFDILDDPKYRDKFLMVLHNSIDEDTPIIGFPDIDINDIFKQINEE